MRHVTQREMGSSYEPWLLSRVHPHAIYVAIFESESGNFAAIGTMLFVKKFCLIEYICQN